MFLTGEGALLAVTLAALVAGIVGAWALLCLGLRKPGSAKRSDLGKPGAVRRVAVPKDKAPKV
jgi:hypothetical protein